MEELDEQMKQRGILQLSKLTSLILNTLFYVVFSEGRECDTSNATIRILGYFRPSKAKVVGVLRQAIYQSICLITLDASRKDEGYYRS